MIGMLERRELVEDARETMLSDDGSGAWPHWR